MPAFNLPPGVSLNDEHINPGPNILEQLETQLHLIGEAVDDERTWLALRRTLKALEQVSQALEELSDRLQDNENATSRAANAASCLANGINPD